MGKMKENGRIGSDERGTWMRLCLSLIYKCSTFSHVLTPPKMITKSHSRINGYEIRQRKMLCVISDRALAGLDSVFDPITFSIVLGVTYINICLTRVPNQCPHLNDDPPVSPQ